MFSFTQKEILQNFLSNSEQKVTSNKQNITSKEQKLTSNEQKTNEQQAAGKKFHVRMFLLISTNTLPTDTE